MSTSALVISPESTLLVAETAMTLQVGDQQLVRERFDGAFPRARHLEDAIAVVEDELMRYAPPATDDGALSLLDPVLHGIAQASGFAAGARIGLDREAVERLFGRLVAVAEGSPASHQGLPDDPAFAARLLILRELMHHWHFRSVSVAAAADAPTGR